MGIVLWGGGITEVNITGTMDGWNYDVVIEFRKFGNLPLGEIQLSSSARGVSDYVEDDDFIRFRVSGNLDGAGTGGVQYMLLYGNDAYYGPEPIIAQLQLPSPWGTGWSSRPDIVVKGEKYTLPDGEWTVFTSLPYSYNWRDYPTP